MSVYRAPMRSRRDDIDAGRAVERALRLAVCGIGGVVTPAPTGLAEALRLTDEAWGTPAARRLERFAAVVDGSRVWTRDELGDFYVGAVVGPWSYDASSGAAEVDLVHVRSCDWRPDEPPDPVLESFARGGRNFQRVHGL